MVAGGGDVSGLIIPGPGACGAACLIACAIEDPAGGVVAGVVSISAFFGVVLDDGFHAIRMIGDELSGEFPSW